MVGSILLLGEKRSELVGWMVLNNLVALVAFILYFSGVPLWRIGGFSLHVCDLWLLNEMSSEMVWGGGWFVC